MAHGRSAYVHQECRCEICNDANNAYLREYATRVSLVAYKRAYYGRNKEKQAQNSRMRLYGLTERQYQALLLVQCGKCSICGDILDPPHVDHDHVTGKTRGLLCESCNKGLGMFYEKPERLYAAIDYLRVN